VRTRWIVAAALVVVGAVWIAQGLGLVPGSGVMDGDTRWAAIGAVLALVGVALAWTTLRGRSGS